MISPMVKDMTVDELREIIQVTVRGTLEDELEDLRAVSSPSYLRSIEEAREDARAGRVVSLEELLEDG